MKNPAWEGIKTVLRPVVFAAIIGAVEGVLQYFKLMHANTIVGQYAILGGTAFLTWLDNTLHIKRSQDAPGANGPLGILPF